MAENAVSDLDAWQKLYDAAVRIKALSPWQGMVDAPIFGVEDAASGELGFVSFGQSAEITVYRGAQGLHGLLYCRREPSPHYPERIMEFPQLQLTFTSKDQQYPRDTAIVSQLGQVFGEPDSWPLFRSVWPGYHPWFLEVDEVTFLACVLEQAGEVITEYRNQPERLAQSGEHQYLVRVQDASGCWSDQVRHIAQPLDMPVQIMMDIPLLERVRRFPHGAFSLELDLFRMPMQSPGHDKRMPCVYMLLAVNASTGLILGQELLHPITTLEAMWGLVAWKTVALFGKLGWIPSQVLVRSSPLTQVLLDMADELDFDLRHVDDLPAVNAARMLLAHLSR
ncbi:MAG: hypothetical protein JXB30_12330 [Anaerolineae bacterium]|nr:hypothetical protein [Anaerolineae bacterium]